MGNGREDMANRVIRRYQRATTMTIIISYAHRHKRPPRYRAQAAFITGPAIVTTRRKRRAALPELTPDEHQRRGDAADALFRDIIRRLRSMPATSFDEWIRERE